MYSEDEYQEFWNQGCGMANLDGHPFVIVTSYELSQRDDFNDFLDSAIGEVEHRDSDFWRDDFWGYSDQYDPCIECRKAICYQPSSGPSDPSWFIEGEGLMCKTCVQKNASEYLEYYHDELRRGNMHEFLLDFAENKYVMVLPRCQNGLHEGDNDDPKPIAKWARQNGWDVAFDVWSDQFTVYFNVYFRFWDEDEWEARELTDEEVAQIREALCTSVDTNKYHSYCSLRHEFKEWPSPADRAKAMLRGQG